jgi:hypothetical protein
MIFIVIFYLMLWASIVLVIKTIIEDCFRDKDLLSLKLSAIPLVAFLILMGLICSVPLVEFLSK